MVNPLTTIRNWFKDLPKKKKYIEVITASLSIPVLLSVVLVNYLSIQDKRSDTTPTPTQTAGQTVITVVRDPDPTSPSPTASQGQITQTPTNTKECTREIGPIAILSPQEGSIVNSNPLTIDVDYNQGEYCSVVWRYRINGASWSDFGDDDIVIYNLPSGQKSIELEVKSIVANVSKTVTRTFSYTNIQEVPTATPTIRTEQATPTPSS
ncbi:MAG: hypothetical protein O3B87_02355 [bacterium]|nr:hypothetical protein [bacterium]